ncbi:hypothetical protein L1049_024477 [Liquidambar formosana]|uniref:Uncharacterized protein n=1 Tax=Liquidambar formosana TaxID=63359 RepID=A0AAP0S109_LIQFO
MINGYPDCGCQPVAVAVGDTVYWFTRNGDELYAYDFNLKKAFSGYISFVDLRDLRCHGLGPSFLHLVGDVFCLFWSDFDRDEKKPNLMRCHCVKFRVSKGRKSSERPGCLILNASLKSCQSYRIDHCICFLDSQLL